MNAEAEPIGGGPDSPTVVGWFDSIGKAVAAAGAIAVATGIVWNFGYFSALDLKLMSLLTLNDYSSSILKSAPFALIASFVGMATLVLDQMTRADFTNGNADTPPRETNDLGPRLADALARNRKSAKRYGALLFVTAIVLPRQLRFVLGAPVVAYVFWLAHLAAAVTLTSQKRAYQILSIGLSTAFILTVLCFAAMYEASVDAYFPTATAPAKVRLSDNRVISGARVLRYLDRGVLLYSRKQDAFLLVQWKDIEEVKHPRQREVLDPLANKLYSLFRP